MLLGARDPQRGRDAIDSLCREQPDWASRLELLQIDVADAQSVAAARDRVVDTCGAEPAPLYGIVNNAGIGLRSTDMRAVLEVNTLGVKRVCDVFVPLIEPTGRIVNVSSASGPNFVSRCSPQLQEFFRDGSVTWKAVEDFIEQVIRSRNDEERLGALGMGDSDAYGFSKACVNLYTLILAREVPQLFINACTPGYIETDLTRPHAEAQGVSPSDLGMKPPLQGTVPIMALLFDEPRGSGHYYGSDARRSPLDRYRAPGDPEYTGE
ncbi:MAG: SDR family NAD(P)-dependent oxidoreductase [Halioglobus sp.]|nr:SDR family NAD(P)-dependent oxidoreductase [Halioglobus sp.]